MSSKTKYNRTGLSETPTKTSPATPRVSKLSRGVAKSETHSPSPLQSGRLSVDRSPQSVNSKPAISRAPKATGTPEKSPARVVRGAELQAQLSVVEEDLKKAKKHIALLEKEKGHAIDELKQAQKVVEEANEKLQEALVAQKRAEENSEIEKFRVVELEQAGIDAAQKKEEEWQKELEAVRSQHALDVSALFSTTQELQKAKQELAMIIDAKNQALIHADDATRIAEIHAEKAAILSAELARAKALLDSEVQSHADESNKLVLQLREEIDIVNKELEKAKGFENKMKESEASIEQLRQEMDILNKELQKAKGFEDKVMEKEESIEQLQGEMGVLNKELQKAKDFECKVMEREASIGQLNVELEAAKMVEAYALNLVEEWQCKFEELGMRMEQVVKLERSASESFGSITRQLQESNNLLHESRAEIASLKEKVGLLEATIGRQRVDLEESEHRVTTAKEEVSSMVKEIESLNAELGTVKAEKAQALENEKLAASSVQSILEERNKLINELDNYRAEEVKGKEAMESLALALHEVSVQAREAKEKLVSYQAERGKFESQIEDLRLVLKATKERYETILGDAKREVGVLKNSIEVSGNVYQKSKTEWEQREQDLINALKGSEEKNSSLEKEIDRLVNLLRHTEEEAYRMREDEAHLKYRLKEVETEVVSLQEDLGEAKAENVKLKESLLDKETELQNVLQGNEELRAKEAVALKKVEELSKLLIEAKNENQHEEIGELTDGEKDYDLLPKVVEFSEENGHTQEEKPTVDLPLQQCNGTMNDSNQEQSNGLLNGVEIENVNGKPKEDEKEINKHENDSVEVELKMWDSCKIEKKECSPERETEHESLEEEVDAKAEGGDGNDQINSLSSSENVMDENTSPSEQLQQKKKKHLLRKFGSLLKKKAGNSPK